MNTREQGQEPRKQAPQARPAGMIQKEEVLRIVKGGPGDLVLLDARDRAEYAQGHIPGARSMPLAAVETLAAGLDRSRQYVTYFGAST